MIYSRETAYADDYQFSVHSHTGGLLEHRTSDYHAYPFSVHGYDNWRHLAIAHAVCRPGETIIEIGANVGVETVGFADIVGPGGKVIAFEPLPQNFAALQNLVKLNGYDQVSLYPWAVGDESGLLSFAIPLDPSLSGSGHVVHADTNSAEQIEVTCTSLDDLAAEFRDVSAIFMDAEGSEELIIRGGQGVINEFRPIILLEAAPNLLERLGCSSESLYQTLRDLEYQIYSIEFLNVEPVSIERHKRKANWLALPSEKLDCVPVVNRQIMWCGLSPFVLGINPLMKV